MGMDFEVLDENWNETMTMVGTNAYNQAIFDVNVVLERNRRHKYISDDVCEKLVAEIELLEQVN